VRVKVLSWKAGSDRGVATVVEMQWDAKRNAATVRAFKTLFIQHMRERGGFTVWCRKKASVGVK